MNFTRLFILMIVIGLFTSSKLFSQNALDFDGYDDYVSTNYYGISGQGARTIEAWIKTTANANPSAGGSQKVIVDYGSMVTGGRFTFCILWSNAIRIEVGGSGLSGTIAVNDGVWHHVAAVYNPTATNKFSLYVDGVLDVAGNITTTVNTSSSIPFTIGKRVDNINLFQGQIDEVRFYNVARTATQILTDKNKEYCSSNTSLLVYFKLNQGIASGNNSGLTTALGSNGLPNGTLYNFSLSGSTSNWVAGKSLSGSTYNSITASACSSYLSPSGKTYSTTGTYTDTLTNSIGCDSIITINLTIGGSYSNINDTSCFHYTSPSGKLFTQSGNYVDTLLGGNYIGCDSIINISLTVYHIDTSITVVNETLISSEFGATFQWLNCDNNFAPISGATSYQYTATQNGHYAVELTKYGCVDTSSCHLINSTGISENLGADFLIYPNPVSDFIEITLNKEFDHLVFQLLSIDGKIIMNKKIERSSKFDGFLDIPKGYYIVKLISEESTSIKSIIKN